MYIFTPQSNFPKVSRKLLSLLTLLIFQTGFALAQDAPFITVWQTDNPGSSEDNQITIPGTGTDYLIEWEEVDNEANNNGSQTGTDEHTVTFPSAGTYRVKISGDFTRIRFSNGGDKGKILNIEQWGDIAWSSFNNAFYGCSNLNQTALDVPDISNVTDMSRMFYLATSFNGSINSWNVSNVTNMQGMFTAATTFNKDLNSWDVSNVTDMSRMFSSARTFNKDLNNWDVSNVTSMSGMFLQAYDFNGDISNWNVSKVTDMNTMFFNESSFNGDIGNWDVSNVINMNGMFYNADAFNKSLTNWNVSNVTDMGRMFMNTDGFNGNISNWDVSNVTHMSQMFFNAKSFNGDISNWDVSNVNSMTIMFLGAEAFNQSLGTWNISNVNTMVDIIKLSGINNFNYESTLIGWANQGVIPRNIDFGDASGLTYCSAFDARSKLINDFGWTFSGDVYCLQNYFVSVWKTDNEGESNPNQIIIPGAGTDYLIEWEQIDDLANSGNELGTDNHILTLPNSGEYRIKISGDFQSINFANSGDKNKILSVDSWGDIIWETMGNAFYGCQNLVLRASNSPNLSLVSDMSYAFKGTNITGIHLKNWDTQSVTNMEGLFNNATQFNGNLASWDVSSVISFKNLFSGATNFNQDLASWDISAAENLFGMLDNSGLSILNYVSTINAWSLNTSIPSNLNLGAVGLKYCYESGRNFLIESKNWTFSGDSKDCSNQFVTVWKTDNPGTSEDNQITIPGTGTDYLIEWEEVGNEANNNASETGTENHTITFPSVGTYRVKISGNFTRIIFYNSVDKQKILDIEQWGDIKWSSFEGAFYGCKNLNQSATDVPDLLNVTNMSLMFGLAESFNSYIGDWDVSNVTDMSKMFQRAYAFNQDLGSWDVGKVTSMEGMFQLALAFNQDLGGWDIGNVTDMGYMFQQATAFNQALGNWEIASATSLDGMFDQTGLNTVNYDKILSGWASQGSAPTEITFGAQGMKYCESEEARNTLINEKDWTIEGDELRCEDLYFNTIWKTDNSGSSNDNQITIPAIGTNYTILWEEVGNPTNSGEDVGNAVHTLTFPQAGIYKVSILDDFSGITFNNTGDKEKLIKITQWGESTEWVNMEGAFYGASHLKITASDLPNTTNVTSISNLFKDATHANVNIGEWNISNVSDMTGMLENSGMGNRNYNNMLQGWANQKVIPLDINLDGNGLSYCSAEEAKSILMNDYNWTISNDLLDCERVTFNSIWKTDNQGTSEDNQITIPGTGTDYLIEWEEAGNEANNKGSETGTDDHTITFPSAGTYRVKISGDFTRIRFPYQGDNKKILDIEQWGDIVWASFRSAFYRCSNLTQSATNVPDLSNVTDMTSMFMDATSFNGAIGLWDVSNVTNMSDMFSDAENFNQDLGNWDVSSVTNMSAMFDGAASFNGAIDSWDVYNVTNMSDMFSEAESFNQDIGSWDVSNVTDMSYMFYRSWDFNQDLGSWDVSKVTDMSSMFYWASIFDQDIGNWDVSNVKRMDRMFSRANRFNHDISKWNVSNVTNMSQMFDQTNSFNQNLGGWDISSITNMSQMFGSNFAMSGLNTVNYDKTLSGWASLESIPSGISFGALGLKYCESEEERNTLINEKGWTIEGDELNCEDLYFITIWKTDNSGISNDNQITIPAIGTNYTILWEELGNPTNSGEDVGNDVHTITFPQTGTYKVRILGDFSGITFNNTGDKEKLIEITQWGESIEWMDIEGAFYGASHLKINASDLPNTTNVTSMANLFHDAPLANVNMGEWNISNVSDMTAMLDNSGMSNGNYNNSLLGWANQVSIPSNISLDGNGLRYCLAEEAKSILMNDYNWVITNDLYDCGKTTFNTIWKTDNVGSSEDNQIRIPGTGSDYIIEWEEVGNEANNNGIEIGTNSHTITFPNPGTYRVKINGDFTKIRFFNSGDKDKILDIEQWGDNVWSNFDWAFYGCTNLNQTATDTPDLSQVTDMINMFRGATSFNGTIGSWDVSNVTDMGLMFYGSRSFNQDLGNWDVSNVTSMRYMFRDATSFNGNIGSWDVSNVVNMSEMFFDADSFNQDLDYWDVSSVTDMSNMFRLASSFNSQIGSWDVSNVTNMSGMFRASYAFNGQIDSWDVSNVIDMSGMFFGAYEFNQDLGNWDVSSVTNLTNMFRGSSSFNGAIGSWDVSNVTEMTNMFDDSGLDTYNYDQTLIGWSALNNVSSNVNVGAANMKFCLSEEARNILINEKGWTISGDTKDCQSEFFVSTWKTENEGTSEANQISIPGTGSDYGILWEEVVNTDNNGQETGTDNHTITFPQAGTYRIKIYGDFTNIRFANQGDKAKILDIENWGEIQWTSMNSAFAGVENLTISASDTPDLSLVTDISYMFSEATNFNSNINNWDVSNIERMAGVFYNATSFNQNLDNWNTSNVTTMSDMFWEATSFNQDLNNWDVASVTNMRSMFRQASAFNGDIGNWTLNTGLNFQNIFYEAESFNQDISNWDVSNMTDLSDMFHGASAFNQDLSNWDVSNVIKMTRMFARTSAFNQDLNTWNTVNVEEMDFMFWDADAFSGNISDWNTSNVNKMWGMFYSADSFDIDISTWDVSAVTNMREMFREASSFNQNISTWNVSSVNEMSGMFFEASSFDQNLGDWDLRNVSSLFEFLTNSGLSLANYDLSLEGWATSGNIASDIALSADGLFYCLSTEYRQQLIDDFGIGLIGDIKDCETGALISLWKTDNEGSSEDNQISIPLIGNHYAIDWEEVDNPENSGFTTASDEHTVTFPHAGTYKIRIFGDLNQIAFNNEGDRLKLQEIRQWGGTSWSSMSNAFSGVENLIINSNDTIDLSMVTDMSYMFSNATNFNSDISHWNMSNITDMSGMFHGASSFNQDLSNWDVSNVNNMSSMFNEATTFNRDLNSWNTEKVNNMNGMFYSADSFNVDISNWNVSAVKNMQDMFREATSFNREINAWNVSNVTEMSGMFYEATTFNSNIGDWNTSNVNNMSGMFHSADSFNTDISTWDVSAVTNMQDMFRETSSFNQGLSSWNVSNVTEMSGMFYEASAFDQNLGYWDISNVNSLFEFLTNSGLSLANYDLSLEGWATNANIPSNIALSAEGLIYCASEQYRQQLIDDFGWNIMGDQTCSLAMEETFPAAEATSVEKNTEIYLTFDQEIEEIDLSGITLKDVSGNAISLTDIYIDSLTLHLVHSGLGSNTYEVVIPESSIISITGKENDSITWSFATQRILSSKEQQKQITHAAFPNPFSDYTTIQFNVPQTQSVNLLIFDLKGQIVRQEKYDNLGSDEQSIQFERKDLPTGLYRYQLQSAGGIVGGKMLIE